MEISLLFVLWDILMNIMLVSSMKFAKLKSKDSFLLEN